MRLCNSCRIPLQPTQMFIPSEGAYCAQVDLRSGEVETGVLEPVDHGHIRVGLWCPNCDGEAEMTITPLDLIPCEIDAYAIISKHAGETTWLGDLAGDVLADNSFPLGKHTVGHFLKYLESQNACDQAIEVFCEAIK